MIINELRGPGPRKCLRANNLQHNAKKLNFFLASTTFICDSITMIAKQQLLNFDNLAFHKHPSCQDGIMAQLNMGGIVISVVANILQGRGLYGRVEMCQETEQFDYLNGEYEVAMWKEGDVDMIPLSFGDDVLGWQSSTQVSYLMAKAQCEGSVWVDELIEERKESRRELGLDD